MSGRTWQQGARSAEPSPRGGPLDVAVLGSAAAALGAVPVRLDCISRSSTSSACAGRRGGAPVAELGCGLGGGGGGAEPGARSSHLSRPNGASQAGRRRARPTPGARPAAVAVGPSSCAGVSRAVFLCARAVQALSAFAMAESICALALSTRRSVASARSWPLRRSREECGSGSALGRGRGPRSAARPHPATTSRRRPPPRSRFVSTRATIADDRLHSRARCGVRRKRSWINR